MYNRYNNWLVLSLFLEKVSTVFWTSKVLLPKHNLLYVPNNWFFLYTQILKNELTMCFNFLVENSAIDLTNSNPLMFLNNFSKNTKLLLFYTFYIYTTKSKITLFFNTSFKNQTKSIDTIYNNANWVERETSEMYNINFYFKNDIRRIMLDYSKIENPLLKNFPSEGYNDLFYSFFENQVIIKQSEVVEL